MPKHVAPSNTYILSCVYCHYVITIQSDVRTFWYGFISIIYSECVFVASGIQHEMRMRHIVICDLPDSTVFFHINGMIFERKNY